MQKKEYQIVVGLAIGMVVLLIAVVFIVILVLYSNKRKKLFREEKLRLQAVFNEQLLQSTIEMQEQTFETISQEIHDNVGQVLSLAKVQVNILEQRETLDLSLLNDLKEGISKALTDLRDIAKSLNSDRIRLSSMPEVTRHELQRIGRLGTIQTYLHLEGTEQSIPEQKKLILLRMLQESIQNILKHSQAKTIKVSFAYAANQLTLVIADDGIGFDQPMQQQEKSGLGLQNIISRAALIGGHATINSKPQHGTTITITLPYA